MVPQMKPARVSFSLSHCIYLFIYFFSSVCSEMHAKLFTSLDVFIFILSNCNHRTWKFILDNYKELKIMMHGFRDVFNHFQK